MRLNRGSSDGNHLSSSAGRPAARKILSVNTADVGGGAERIALALSRGYRERGHESWLIVGDKRTDDPHVMPIFASPHMDYRPYENRQTPLADRALRAAGLDDFDRPFSHRLLDLTGPAPDLVHLHNLHGGYFDLRAIETLSQARPVFLTLHDEWLLGGHRTPGDLFPPARDILRRTADGLSLMANRLRRSRILGGCRIHVSAPSQSLLDQVEGSPLAPAVSTRRVIPNGIDLSCFRPYSRQAARDELRLNQDEFMLAFAAHGTRSNARKDYRLIRAALRRLASPADVRIRLLAIGEEGPSESSGRVTIDHLPFVEAPVLARYFQAADLYVHAAKTEPFGLVIAEAMACGTPVVATAVGGIPEVIGRDSGFLVPPGDADAMARVIRWLVEDRDLCERLGRRAAQEARIRFDARRMVDDYLGWFDDVCGTSTAQLRAAA